MASTLHRLRASHVQGVIIVAPVRRVIQAVTELDGDMPLVVVGGDPAIGAPTVTIDQLEGARLATQHLLDLGHRTVHHVAGPQTWVDATRAHARLVRCPPDTPAPRGRPVAGDWSARRGYDAGTRLARDADVTRCLRRQRPDCARGDPGAARRRPPASPRTSAWWASTTRRNRATSCRRSPPSARTSARSAGAASSCCSHSPTANRRSRTSSSPPSSSSAPSTAPPP